MRFRSIFIRKPMDFEKIFNKDLYQVFLYTCPASLPLSFATHSWFVLNRKGKPSRFEVLWKSHTSSVSWGHLHKDFYPPMQGLPKFFFSESIVWKNVKLSGYIEGDTGSLAEVMVNFIEQSPYTYPYCHTYSLTGPNSNTYVSWILKYFPESKLGLKWNSFGKKF